MLAVKPQMLTRVMRELRGRLAALGLGHALLQLGDVTGSRRLAGAAEVLLGRAGAPIGEVEQARRLRGTEAAVGHEVKEIE